jgi:hypothetical protein
LGATLFIHPVTNQAIEYKIQELKTHPKRREIERERNKLNRFRLDTEK